MAKKITNTEKEEVHPEWVGGGNPDAIEEQEARGQQELVNSSQLPRKINSPLGLADKGISTQEYFESRGIKTVGLGNDELFLDVVLPRGWKLKPTDHSMWSELLDENGKRIASIFYKAAFYDRDAFIDFE